MNHPPGPPLPPPQGSGHGAVGGAGGPGDPRGAALYPHQIPPPPGMALPPMPGYPMPPLRVRDPGTRTGSLVAKLILIPLLLFVAALQQFSIYAEPPEEPGERAAIEAPTGADEGLLVTRLFLKIAKEWPALAGQGEPLRSMDVLWEDMTNTPVGHSEREWKIAGRSRVDEFRAAVVAGETGGPDVAIGRFDDLEARLNVDGAALEAMAIDRIGPIARAYDWRDPDSWKRLAPQVVGPSAAEEDEAGSGESPDAVEAVDAGSDEPEEALEVLEEAGEVFGTLNRDAALLARHYRNVRRDSGVAPLAGDEWAELEEHHGWFAELARIARASKAEADTPEREALLAGGGRLIALLTAAGLLVVMALVGMVAASIWLVVMLSMRRLRFWFVPPIPGGSVYLETVAAFLLAFLGTQILTGVLAVSPALKPRMIEIAMGVQWLVLLVVFWPLLRGVSMARWRRDLGLIAPRGVMREIAAGFVGYLAGLPLVIIAGVIGFILKSVQDRLLADRLPYTTGGNPVLEMVTTGGVLQLVLFLSVATLWAPLVEEMVFRGCLYRHLRSRVVFLLAGPLSALAFGIMHGYELVLLGPVIALGATFAFVREWRGSLVGPIVMHALHNGTLLLIVVSLVRMS